MTDQETEILTTLDESQRTVVLAQDGHHLVLAPSGLRQDPHPGLPRALGSQPRGGLRGHALPNVHQPRRPRMINRIGEVMAGEDLGPLHVGNVHHFCSRFLFEQQVVPADSSIVSDEGDHQHPGRLHPRRRGARDPRLPVQPQLPADTLLLPPHGSDASWPSVESVSAS